MEKVFLAFWFFLPGGLGNLGPVIGRSIPILKKLNQPIDMNIKWRGKRLLGDNKTWQGLISAVIMGIIVIALQKLAYAHSGWIRDHSYPVNYSLAKIWLLGVFLGLGAIVGDMIKSFFKRQAQIKPGKSWLPFDQIDYIIGGCLLAAIIVRLSPIEYLIIAVLWVVLHIIFNYVGYLVGVNDEPI